MPQSPIEPKASKHQRGEHAGIVFTPQPLARRLHELLCAISGPQPTVLDPACGDGALLAATIAAASSPREYARRHVFGIEIDPELASRARERLLLAAGLPPGDPLERNIVCADALDPATPWVPNAWILANPPWLSFSGRHASPDRDRSRPRGPGGWPSLQAAFLERIARHVGAARTGAAILIPGSVTELAGYGPLRRSVTEHAVLSAPPIELGERAFPGVTEPATMVQLVAGGSGAGSPAAWLRSGGRGESLVRRLATFPRLPKRTFADPGVHTGNSARELILPANATLWPGVRRGRDLRPFQLDPPAHRLRTDLKPTGERRFRIAQLAHYASFPILLRQTADRPLAARHQQATYFRNSLLACRGTPELEDDFLVALLNSPVAAWWHRSLHRDARQRSFPQVKVGHLDTQPLPFERREQDPRAHDRIVAAVRSLQAREAGFEERIEELGRAVVQLYGLSREELELLSCDPREVRVSP